MRAGFFFDGFMEARPCLREGYLGARAYGTSAFGARAYRTSAFDASAIGDSALGALS